MEQNRKNELFSVSNLLQEAIPKQNTGYDTQSNINFKGQKLTNVNNGWGQKQYQPRQNKVKGNPLNLCLINTYKLQIKFKPGVAYQSGTYSAWVCQNSYRQYLGGYGANPDFNKGLQGLIDLVQVQYAGLFVYATIFQNRGLVSTKILQYALNNIPLQNPEHEFIPFTNADFELNKEKMKTYL